MRSEGLAYSAEPSERVIVAPANHKTGARKPRRQTGRTCQPPKSVTLQRWRALFQGEYFMC